MKKLVMGGALGVLVALSARTVARPSANMNEPSPPVRKGKTYQIGVASWYGNAFQGKDTASGEPFNKQGLTAAHRKLPLGTKIKVTNLANHRSLILEVNDRGPRNHTRLLDVSKRAAKLLGFLNRGLVPVRIDVVSKPGSLMAGTANAPVAAHP